MIPANSLSATPRSDESPLALLQAENKQDSFPLREYLESHGCNVFDAPQENVIADYHIAIGVGHFVKSIFALPAQNKTKRLGIVLLAKESLPSELLKEINARIVASDAEKVTSRDVPSIFAFFFASEERYFPLNSSVDTETGSRGRKPLDQPPGQSDKQRISDLIKRIYTKETKKRLPSIVNRGKLFWALGTVLILLSPLVIHTITLFLSVAMLGATALSIKKNVPSIGLATARTADVFLSISTKALQTTKTIAYPIPPAHGMLRSQERILSLIISGKQIAESFMRLKEEGTKLSRSVLSRSETTETSVVSVETIRKELSYLQRLLGVFMADSTSYKESTVGWNTAVFALVLDKVTKDIPQILQVVTLADRALSLYPDLGGFSGEKHYVVLLQNSSELRPTGGFIGGVGQMTVREGKIENFTVLDVYDLDGQLRGHVEPPFQIREVLGEVHWYLRDSNWNPDFRESGSRALWFYEKESGLEADGVFALNTRLLQEVLRVMGPLDLPDYQDRITADNFFEKSFNYIHTDFFPGSTQKKDFLGSLVNAAMVKVGDNPQNNALALLDVLVQGILQHDILVYIKNQQVQATVDQYNWSNRVPGYSPCSQWLTSYCIGDFVFTVDANLGLSKVNQFIQKEVLHEISFSEDGTRKETLEIQYHNSAQENTAGGGVYRNYARIYIPSSKNLQTLLLNNTALTVKDESTSSATPPYTELVAAPPGLVGVGVVFDVGKGDSSTIKLEFADSTVFQKKDALFELYYQKQPGVDQSITTTILYPQTWKVVPFSSGFTGIKTSNFVAKTGHLEYNSTHRTDELLQAKISR